MPRDVKNMVLGEVFSHLRKLLQILSEGVDLISQKFRKQFVAEVKVIRGYVELLSLNFAFPRPFGVETNISTDPSSFQILAFAPCGSLSWHARRGAR